MARPEPRLSSTDRATIIAAIRMAGTNAEAEKIIDRLWAKAEGDMQDRINVLIEAAAAAVDSHSASSIDGLARALRYLRGREVAATPTKQLREGPWHGHV